MRDPAYRKVRCPKCGELVPLDAQGRYPTHGANPKARRYCENVGKVAFEVAPPKRFDVPYGRPSR